MVYGNDFQNVEMFYDNFKEVLEHTFGFYEHVFSSMHIQEGEALSSSQAIDATDQSSIVGCDDDE